MPEESTVRLYHRLEDGLGKDMASVLVENFATKQDLAAAVETLATKAELKEGLADVKGDVKATVADLETKLHRDMRAMALALVGTNIALVTAVTAAARFV